jgi:hypothetical protein
LLCLDPASNLTQKVLLDKEQIAGDELRALLGV